MKPALVYIQGKHLLRMLHFTFIVSKYGPIHGNWEVMQ